jgi:hypothetical protein
MILLPALAVAFAAFCVWLAVRIVNRRERWAKRIAWGVAGLLLLYPLSLGPACRKAAEPMDLGYKMPVPRTWMTMYWPVGWLASDTVRTPGRSRNSAQQPFFQRFFGWYINLWLPSGTSVAIPASRNGETFLLFGRS